MMPTAGIDASGTKKPVSRPTARAASWIDAAETKCWISDSANTTGSAARRSR